MNPDKSSKTRQERTSRVDAASRADGHVPHHISRLGYGSRAGRYGMVEHAKDPVATMRRLLRLLKGRRRFMVLLLIPLAVGSVSGLIWPRVLGLATDIMTLGPGESVDFRKLAGVMTIGLAANIAGQFAGVLLGYGTTMLSNHSVRDMRQMLFHHVQSLPIKRFDTITHGEFMSRLTNDTDMVANTLGPGVLNFAGTIISLVGTFCFMVIISWRMTLVACITLPVSAIVGRAIAKISRKIFRKRQRTVGELNALTEEMITGQRVVQAFCREEIVDEEFDYISEELRRVSFKAEVRGGMMGPAMNLINNISFLLVVVAGGWLAIQGQITVGVIISFMMYSRQFGRPVNELAMQFNMIQSAIAGAERVFTMLDMPPEEDAGKRHLSRPETRGQIIFDNVSFGYNPETTVLRNFSLHVAPGTKVALVGETGSGKTTVVSLLTRFYEIQEGRITIDGIDVRDIAKKNLRKNMAVVLQDTHLFTGTVADNISFGNPDATREQIIAAAKLANADLFIDRLPEGYDTKINQADTALSRGQCQLLSIARAALSDPAILILDEATSNVDTRTEMHIQQAMLRLMRGRTSIVIAHRLSTIRDADTILVMHKGEILESGNHEDLLAKDGYYAALCHR